MLHHTAAAHHVRPRHTEFLLLFRRQQLTDILHLGDMGQVQVRLLRRDGLERGLHTGYLHRLCVEQLVEIDSCRVNIGLETNDLFALGT